MAALDHRIGSGDDSFILHLRSFTLVPGTRNDAIELRNSGAFREPFPTWDCDCIVVMKADKIREV